MKKTLRCLAALLLAVTLLTGAADTVLGPAVGAPFVTVAQAAGNSTKTSAYIVTWDNRTVRAGKAFAQSDNGQLYEAPLTIYYSNADRIRIRFLDPNGRVVGSQDVTYSVYSRSGSLSYSCSVPVGSKPGNYKVRVDLTNGKKSSSFNFTWKVTKYVHTARPSSYMQSQFNYLQRMLPQGRYWNHGVNNVQTIRLDNGAVTTISTSRCNAWSHKKENFREPQATCNYANHGYQCHGFAMLLATYVWGSEPTSSAKVTDRNAADTLEPGDVVRYLNDKHTIFILKVEQGTVYFADCNWGHTCRIRWNGKISAANLKKTFSYVYKYSKRWN